MSAWDRERSGPSSASPAICCVSRSALPIRVIYFSYVYIPQTAWRSSWEFDRSVPGPMIDCTDLAYAGAVVIYMMYAAQYGIFQNMVIYILGTLTNEPRRTAAIGGLFVGSKSGRW